MFTGGEECAMRNRSAFAAVVFVLAWTLPLGSPVGAGAMPGDVEGRPGDTHCLAEFDVVISPGLTNSPSSGTLTTNGETGTITCDGPINGYQPTGVGTRGEVGHYGVNGPDTCGSGGEAEVSFSFTIPTTGGDQHVVGTFTVDYGPLEGGSLYGGTLTGPQMYGKFDATPVEGDCVTTPLTRVHLRCDEWVVNARRS
jgi:hypothetical protein